MNEGSFTVYGGNGHHRIGVFKTRAEAEQFASDFESKCWNGGAPVPRSIIRGGA